MRRIFHWLLRWICLLPLINLMIAFSRITLAPLHHSENWNRLLNAAPLWAAAAGLTLRLLLTRWRRGDPLEFADTLEHELTHALTGTLTLATPVSLKATLRKGGEVELSRTNPVAVLAPYFLPLYATFLSLLSLVLQSELQATGRILIGFFLGSFAYRLGREFHLGQTDFQEYGLLFSFLLIAALLPLSLGLVLQTSKILDLSWRHGIWPLFLDQLHWVWVGVRHTSPSS